MVRIKAPTKPLKLHVHRNCGATAGDLAGSYSQTPHVLAIPNDLGAYMVATDGRSLSVTRATGMCHERVAIPKKAIPTTKVGIVEIEGTVLKNSQGNGVVAEGASYPNVSDVLKPMEGRYHMLKINARLLRNIAKAIDDEEHVILYLDTEGDYSKPIAVEGSRGIGLLCNLSDTETGSQEGWNRFAESVRSAFTNCEESDVS